MRAALAVAALVLTATALPACTQTDPTEAPDAMDRPARYDLTAPPTRDDLGYPADAPALAFDRGTGDPLPVGVDLPQGRTLDLEAFRVDSVAGGREAPPTSLYVYTSVPRAQADAALEGAAAVLGLTEADVARGRAVYESPARPDDAVELVAPPLDYLTVGLGVRKDERREDVTVIYEFTWTAAAPAPAA